MNSKLFDLTQRFAFPLWKFYFLGIIALIATTYVALLVPDLSKLIVNDLLAGANLSKLENLALVVAGLGFVQILVRSISRILIFWPGRVVEEEVKNFYFARFLRLPKSFFEAFGMGDLISRLANDVTHIRVFFAFAVLQALNLTFLVAFALNKMFAIHAKLAIFTLLPLALMIVVTRFGMPMLHKFSKLNQEAIGQLTNRVTEAFVNVPVVKANAASASFVDLIETENENVYKTNLKLVMVRTFVFPVMVLSTGFSYLVVLGYGGAEAAAGRITVGDILAFNVYIGMLAFPLTALGIIMAVYQRATTAAERLEDLDEASEEEALVPVAPKPNSRHLLEVKSLQFQYPNPDEKSDTRFSLDGIEFNVDEGKKIGITGEVGSGKTTLLNLITRIYDPPKGTVFWKGQDILSYDPDRLRSELGYAEQSVHLFSDSIQENIAFGTGLDPASKEIQEAAQSACVYDDIMRFPEQWLTEVGEQGVRLSGGQKQRLSLSRVFLRNPEIYLLDDVTSAVDQETERQIFQHIDREQKAMLIISHRASSLEGCDEVLMLKDGRVIDRGSLDELKQRNSASFLSE